MEWEVTTVVLGPSEQQTEATNALRGQGWQAYAVTWTPTCGYTAWFRRPSRNQGLVHKPWPAGRDLPADPALMLRDTLDEDDGDTPDGDGPGPLVTMIVSPSSR